MRKFIACIVITCWMLTHSAFGQITIAPTNLFIDSNSKFGTYMVINNSSEPQEVSIDFLFEYGIAGNNGIRKTIYDDSTAAKVHSVHDYIKAFPKNFVLSPNQRQIIRLRVSAPPNLEDGTYWARIKTTSVAQSPPLEIGETDGVSANVGIKLAQVTGLFYKKGDVSTGINISDIRTKIVDNKLMVYADYSRTGNSPFLGTITTKLTDSRDAIKAEDLTITSIYFDGTHREILDLSDISSGKYKVSVEFISHRSDVSPQDIIQMQPVTKTVTITIP